MKKTICFVLAVIIIPLLCAYAEKEIYIISNVVAFQTVLSDCQQAFSEKTGLPLENVEKLEYTWNSGAKYLVIPSSLWSPEDAEWYIRIKNITNDQIVQAMDYWASMTEQDPLVSSNSYVEYPLTQKDSITITLEKEYDEQYSLADDAAAKMLEEHGPYFLWDYQLKADFYSRWNIQPFFRDDYISGYFDYEKCFYPEENDVPFEQALMIAKNAIREEFHIPDSMMEFFSFDARFCTHFQQKEALHWEIIAWMNVECGGMNYWISCIKTSISRDGGLKYCVID